MPQSERTTGASIQLRGVTKRYSHDGRPAVGDVSLDVAPGEFVTLLGPSGSGKSTTLNMIVGFTDPSEGEILVDGRAINDVPPHKRDLGMVFQDYALFPHMTAAQNIEFPLRYRKVPKAERQRRVDEALEFVELPGYGGRLPRDLSGGERQRVAIARAIVARPVALLMDEPLGALDKKLRESLQVEIRHLHQELGITFVYVTHDQDEALALSDRIAVFNRG
ncbi:MAG: ATP-binding cassette domain-containing protein, partial [Solirubrobacterales bacterium]